MRPLDAEFKFLEFSIPDKPSKKINGIWKSGTRLVLRGASGCGKTTLLKVLAGLRPSISGSWSLDSQEMTHLAPHVRRCGYVFQSGALFDHLSVLENLTFGMRNFFASHSVDLLNTMALQFLKKIGLEGLEARSCAHLSGGERQRVAIARTLLCEPKYLLFDEPLSAVDQENRRAFNNLILGLLEDRPIPVILVTHDLDEAKYFGQKIIEWKEVESCLEL